jgi:GTP-binding protein
MMIKSAEFVCSNTKMDKLPPPTLPEYAFIGRSNVGKSSLINAITQRKGLAKTSQTPGKTQLINHFLINKNWYLVDLPGYGYAKTSRDNRAEWGKFIKKYLFSRENLQCVFVLIDSSLEPQKIDLEFCYMLGDKGIPFILVFTKADKQSHFKSEQNITLFHTALAKWFEERPPHYLTSAENRLGCDDVLALINDVNQKFTIEH